MSEVNDTVPDPQTAPQPAPQPDPRPVNPSVEQRLAEAEAARAEAAELRARVAEYENRARELETNYTRYKDTFKNTMRGGHRDVEELRHNLLYLYDGDENIVNAVIQNLPDNKPEPTNDVPDDLPDDDVRPLPDHERVRVEVAANQHWESLVDRRVQQAEKYIAPVVKLRASQNGTTEAQERAKIRGAISKKAFDAWNRNVGRLPNGDIDFRSFDPIINETASGFEEALGLVIGDKGFLGQSPAPSPVDDEEVPVPIRSNYRSQAEFEAAKQNWRAQNNRRLAQSMKR